MKLLKSFRGSYVTSVAGSVIDIRDVIFRIIITFLN